MISWSGQLEGTFAFSKLNREIIAALKNLGTEVFFGKEGLVVQSQYPYVPPINNTSLLIMTWEFGGAKSLPRQWVNLANSYRATLAMSEWVARVFYSNGIRNVASFHLGINPKIYNSLNYTPPNKSKFLLFGGSDPRHGLDFGIQAFNEANIDAELVIKVSPNYPLPNIPTSSKIKLNQKLLTETELASFYKEHTALLMPLKGAGPGMIGLEAMACGLPVITANGSGMAEYSKHAYKVDFSIEKTTHHCVPSPEPYWIVPNFNQFVEHIKFINSNHAEAYEVGKKSSEYILSEWTWEHTAKRLQYIFNAVEKEIEVSIVILVHDRKIPVLHRCIDSIIQHTKDVGFELIIVDQNLYNWEYSVNNAVKHPYNQVLRLEENIGVSGGRNVGLKAAKGIYTMFLDDDAVVTKDGWLSTLISYFKDPKIGIVGQTGYYIPKDQWGMFWESSGVTECDTVQGYCQVFPTRFRNEIGLLDENFGKFWHEDTDWCLQIKEKGYKVLDANNVGVWHAGSASGDDGTYIKKASYLKTKWEQKTHLFTKKEDWNKPYA